MDILKSSNNVWFVFFLFVIKMEKKKIPKINVHDWSDLVEWFSSA